MTGFDTSEVKALARDLTRASTRTVRLGDRVLDDAADDLQRRWRQNARRTAGRHGRHYPNAITAERVGPLTYEVGPESARPQGGMSFEYGSRNQPPHLDGNRAADVAFPRTERRLAEVAERVARGAV